MRGLTYLLLQNEPSLGHAWPGGCSWGWGALGLRRIQENPEEQLFFHLTWLLLRVAHRVKLCQPGCLPGARPWRATSLVLSPLLHQLPEELQLCFIWRLEGFLAGNRLCLGWPKHRTVKEKLKGRGALPCLGRKNMEVRQIQQNRFYFSLHQYIVDELGSLWRVQSLLDLEIIYSWSFCCFTLNTNNDSNSKTTVQIQCWCCSFPFYKCSVFVQGNESTQRKLQPLPTMDCNRPMKLWECV